MCDTEAGYETFTDVTDSDSISDLDTSSLSEEIDALPDIPEATGEEIEGALDEETEDFSELTASIDVDEFSEMEPELEENNSEGIGTSTYDLSQLDEVAPETVPIEFIEEFKEDHPEMREKIDELIASGRVEIYEDTSDSSEAEEGYKVLTREFTPAMLESAERDREEILNGYRESLQERGADDDKITEYLDQEKEKLVADFESDIRGDTSSNLYYPPTDWDAVAASLSGSSEELDLQDETEHELQEEIAPIAAEGVTEEIEDASFPETIEIEAEENADGNFIEALELDENIDIEEAEEPVEVLDLSSLADVPSELSDTLDLESVEELVETNSEQIQEAPRDIDYDEIYREISQESLEQGFENINIYEDIERLDDSMSNFEEAKWEGMDMENRKESMSDLAEYVKETIGFENPPKIEYYNNPRAGDYGGYDPFTNVLQVNEYMLYNSSEAADTIAHELWHAHQKGKNSIKT